MSDDLVTLNVCILPPVRVAKAVVDLANNLDEAGLHFRVDGSTRRPHLTVLQRRVRRDTMRAYIRRFEHIPKLSAFECSAYGVTLSSNGYIEIGYNRSECLEKLQHAVYHLVADLPSVDLEADLADLSLHERLNVRNYGYKLFDELYRPHISLGAYGLERKEIELPSIVDLSEYSFEALELVLAESDEYGAVVKIVKKVPLAP